VYEKPAILVVEDDDDGVLIVGAFKNHRVVVAHDGAEGLEYLFGTGRYQGRDPFDLPQAMILDLKMPRVDGFQVLTKVRADERTRLLPVVILTSSSDRKDVLRSYDLGANSYLRKPLETARFVEVVLHLGLYWLGLNEAPAHGLRDSS
jgi:two-component system, response regulator